MKNDLARKVGEEAKKCNISLSLHAPYYVNLASEEPEKISASIRRILDSCERGHYLGATCAVFHPAYFGKREKEETHNMVRTAVTRMMETINESGWKIRLAPETTGKHSAYGSLDETIRLSAETGCSLCVDFAHLYARNQGRIDYADILDRIQDALKIRHLHMHFSNIEWTLKGEKKHLVLDGRPPFEPLARELLDRKLDATIISETPDTWRGSLKMKHIFEKLGYRFQ